MLKVDSIQKNFETPAGTLRILSDVTLHMARGEAVAIMGPSGSGKSTLLNILGTLEPPTAGSVSIDGCNPFTLADRDLARFRNRRIGFIFQDHHLLPQCSILENVLLPVLADRQNTKGLTRARELLDRVGLSHRLDHRPAELSGGEKQRAAIARAVINTPALILADEPTGNLDRASADVVANLLSELHKQEQACLVLVTHSDVLASRFARRYEMVAGRLVEALQPA